MRYAHALQTSRAGAARATSGVRSPDGNGPPSSPDPRPHCTWPCGSTCRDLAHRHRLHRRHRALARSDSRSSETGVRPAATYRARMRAGVGQISEPSTVQRIKPAPVIHVMRGLFDGAYALAAGPRRTRFPLRLGPVNLGGAFLCAGADVDRRRQSHVGRADQCWLGCIDRGCAHP